MVASTPILPRFPMNLEQKVGQLFIAPVFDEELSMRSLEYLDNTKLGNVILFPFSNGLTNRKKVQKLTEDLCAAIYRITGAFPILTLDQEGGRVNRLKKGFTTFPSSQDCARTDDVFSVGKTIGAELRSVGITMNLAPVVDILSNPQCPIGNRSYGADPETVIANARRMIDGLHASGVQTVLKHFPGIGGTCVDSHLGLPVLDKSLEELECLEFKPFRSLKNCADAIMVAHVLAPQIDPNHCSSTSKIFITDVLRHNIGYEGCVISDSLMMSGVIGKPTTFEEAKERVADAALSAFHAGCDLFILAKLEWSNFTTTTAQDEELISYVVHKFVSIAQKGEITQERLNASIMRIMKLKNCESMF